MLLVLLLSQKKRFLIDMEPVKKHVLGKEMSIMKYVKFVKRVVIYFAVKLVHWYIIYHVYVPRSQQSRKVVGAV